MKLAMTVLLASVFFSLACRKDGSGGGSPETDVEGTSLVDHSTGNSDAGIYQLDVGIEDGSMNERFTFSKVSVIPSGGDNVYGYRHRFAMRVTNNTSETYCHLSFDYRVYTAEADYLESFASVKGTTLRSPTHALASCLEPFGQGYFFGHESTMDPKVRRVELTKISYSERSHIYEARAVPRTQVSFIGASMDYGRVSIMVKNVDLTSPINSAGNSRFVITSGDKFLDFGLLSTPENTVSPDRHRPQRFDIGETIELAGASTVIKKLREDMVISVHLDEFLPDVHAP